MKITYILTITLIILFGCKKEDEVVNKNPSSVPNYRKISKITCTEFENDIYKGDSLMLEYSGQNISKVSYSVNENYTTYTYETNYVIRTGFNSQDIMVGTDTLYLNSEGYVDYSEVEDIYYTYNSDGYLIADDDCDMIIENGNCVLRTINQDYPDESKRGSYTEYDYYDTLNTNNFYQVANYAIYKFNGIYGKSNRNLLKSSTSINEVLNFTSTSIYTYELDSSNVIVRINEFIDNTWNVEYNLFYY